MLVAVLIGLVVAAPPPAKSSPPRAERSPLAKAVQCYDDLDYDCTEERLAEALELPLSESDRILARQYEALLGIAYRQPGLTRRAVRTIYEIDPEYRPKNVPAELRKKIAQATDNENYIQTVWGRGYVLKDPEPQQQPAARLAISA